MRTPLLRLRRLVFYFSFVGIVACNSVSHKTSQPPVPRELTSAPIAFTPPKILFLGLDGIGFTQFKKMQEGGYFRAFRPVSQMVASFPSISDPNWSKITRTPSEKSFTREHFDKAADDGKGQVVGGLIDHVFYPPRYESYFDFKPEGAVQHLASMTYAETTGLYWLDVLQKRLFETQGKKVFTAFIVNTDFIAHTKGQAGIFRYLAELDKKINHLRDKYKEKFGQELEVILTSDHGNAFLRPKAVNAGFVLNEDGWKVRKNLQDNKDVVYVVPEILSFAPFFVKPNQESSLAKTLSRAEGVHVSFFLSSPNSVDFYSNGTKISPKNQSRVTLDIKNHKLTYKILKGKDPFHQIQFFKSGALTFARYFQETLNEEYPNALIRAWEGLTQNTEQKPSVLVSPQLGFVFSNKTLELITNIMGLESVHGSFHREETLGIFVSTSKDLPPVSPSLVLDYLN